MAQSSQAKEVILEIGEEIGSQQYNVQVQNGTVTKKVFGSCSTPFRCSTSVLNANYGFATNWNGWYEMACTGISHFGNSPSIYPENSGTNPTYEFGGPGASINYAYDSNYNGDPTEGIGIVFTLEKADGTSPGFNGVSNSVNSGFGSTYVNNLKSENKDDTEQGRMLYLVPNASAGTSTRISFEILEGNDTELVVRGPGSSTIGEYLYNNGFSQFTIDQMNSAAWWANFDFYISPYVHAGNWNYDSNGHVNYNSDIETVHASFVPAPNGTENFASMVQDKDVFGLRSSHDIFDCPEGDTDGYELAINIASMTNCYVEVLTFTDSSKYDFALDYAGATATGTDFVWSKIETTGLTQICVPFYYNTIDTEEQHNPNMAGNAGGWSTAIEVDNLPGGYLSTQSSYKKFYEAQYKFIRVKKIDSTLPASLEIQRFALTNSSHVMTSVNAPVYIDRTIEVPAYNYQVLDVYDRDKVPLSLNFNSGDLRDPGKRSTGYSKTFELPASIRNQQFLKTMTADNSQRLASDISWRKARISSNGVVVFNGFARIEKSTTGQGGKYSCHILQDPSYWPELIGDKKLCDLSFPQHTKSYAVVSGSWSQTVDDIPYVYPAINYGEWSKDSNTTQQSHSIADFHPATYAKAIVNQIFADIGYSLQSDFMDEAMFKKLIIPFTGNPDDYISGDDPFGENGDYSSRASLASEQGMPTIPSAGGNLFAARLYRPVIPCQNGCSYYSPGSSTSIQNGYTVPFTGRYTVHYQAQVKLKARTICGNDNPGRWAAFLHVNGQTAGLNVDAGDLAAYAEFSPYSCPWFEDDSNGDWVTNSFTAEIDLQQGDQLQIGFLGRNSKAVCDLEASIKDQDFGVWPVQTQAFVPPTEVSLSQALGCSTKQIDFLKGLTEMFNLYWTADNDTKQVFVEPYDDFYGSGQIVDWSKKIDRKSWTDKFLIDELAKSIRYGYKVDSSDDLVALYNEQEGTELWSTTITNNDLYRKEQKDLGTTVFSPTFRIKSEYNGGDSTFVDSGQWPIMPCMWSGDPVEWWWFNFPDRPDNNTKFNIRILNYHGLSDETGPWSIADDNGNPVTLNSYPYAYTYNYNHSGMAGTVEDNLSWYGIGSGIRYQRGLFDRFYGRLYEKVSGGSALRTCMMDLSQADISHFDFRDIIKIDMDGGIPTYWTVNKIIDYKPGKDVLTKVELVEWKYGFDGGKARKLPPTNYAFLREKGNNPEGGQGTIVGPYGTYVVHADGKAYIPDSSLVMSNQVNATSDLTLKILESNPSLPNNKSHFNQKALVVNKDNGITNNPALNNTLKANSVNKNAIALGSGLKATGDQVVLGNYNKSRDNDTFQVGAGRINPVTGELERINAISVGKDGGFCIYGGEVVADFKTGDLTLTGDVYYTDIDGKKKKVYLKDKIENNY